MSTLSAVNTDGDGEVSQLVETVALNKLCPFTMQPAMQTAGYTEHAERDTFVPGSHMISMPTNCAGSQCMAWEYATGSLQDDDGYCKLVEERIQ